jgi:hypothetical protein
MRRGVVGVIVCVAVAVTGSNAFASSSSSVPVVRCPTVFGVSGEGQKAPATVAVLGHPSSTHGLAAYTNTEEFLIAPAGLQCSGIIAADGGSEIVVWPKGTAKPGRHAHSEGLTLLLDPACASCRAVDACPFFPSLAAKLSFPCSPADVPRGEHTYTLAADTTLFEDPPDVPGDGWPSGGSDPANGIVGLVGSPPSVYRSTCTLPQSLHSVCTVSLNDVLARYGQGAASHPQSPSPKPPARHSSPLHVKDFDGNTLAVSASIFANPATPANEYESVPGGTRLVAIEFAMTGDGPGTVNSDANADATLIGTDGQAYTASFDDIQGCTNFSLGEFTLAPGQSEKGCVAFAVPNGIGIRRVTFSLTDGSVDSVYWTG